jgi:uncharacterized membrane protein
MRTYLKLFCLALPILIAIDASWFGVIASGFYRSQFGQFFRPDLVIWAALLFYALYTLALIFFVLTPALEKREFSIAILWGAALGATANMTYDLSNLATIAGWPLFGALVDIGWGTLSMAVTAGITYIVATKVFRM